MNKTFAWILGIAIIVGIMTYSSYNSFVTGDEKVSTFFAQIETQLQRRFDLIPNLVNSVKGSMTQEQEVFGAIAEARTRYAGAVNQDNKVEAANQVESALARLLVVMENYPDLKSSEAVRDLMTQLEGTENRVSVARQRFNEAVQEYNLMVRRIPGKIFAALFGFDEKTKFEAAGGAETAPEVNFE